MAKIKGTNRHITRRGVVKRNPAKKWMREESIIMGYHPAAIIKFRNQKDRERTIELIPWEDAMARGSIEDESEKLSGWGYGYTAISGKAQESSPELFETKEEAESWAKKRMSE